MSMGLLVRCSLISRKDAGSGRRPVAASVALVAGIAGMLLLRITPSAAHDIITTQLTYTRDISRIFASRCLGCHAERAAIPLTSYEQVRPWAVDIKEQVLSRAMPPWGAVKGFGDLDPDEALTQEEILTISSWVVGGAPQGDPSFFPEQKALALKRAQPSLVDAVPVEGRAVLARSITVAGVRPDPSALVDSVRITAHLPNGRVDPLVWLYHYNPQWKRVFRFRTPLVLPRGTVVEATSDLSFILEKSAKAPRPGR